MNTDYRKTLNFDARTSHESEEMERIPQTKRRVCMRLLSITATGGEGENEKNMSWPEDIHVEL